MDKLIEAVIEQDAVKFESTFSELIGEKVANALVDVFSQVQENFNVGDRVKWVDPDFDKELTGTVRMTKGSKRGSVNVKSDLLGDEPRSIHHSMLTRISNER